MNKYIKYLKHCSIFSYLENTNINYTNFAFYNSMKVCLKEEDYAKLVEYNEPFYIVGGYDTYFTLYEVSKECINIYMHKLAGSRLLSPEITAQKMY